MKKLLLLLTLVMGIGVFFSSVQAQPVRQKNLVMAPQVKAEMFGKYKKEVKYRHHRHGKKHHRHHRHHMVKH